MKKRLYTGVLSLFFLIASGFQSKGLEEYCNGRFGFCIQYPSGFTGQGEAGNGDGQRFLSKDKQAEITTYGMLVLEEINDDLKEQFLSVTKDIQVSYKVIKPNWFVFSGLTKDGKIIYQKTVMKKINYMDEEKPETMVQQTLMITYPKSQQHLYGNYCGVISKSL